MAQSYTTRASRTASTQAHDDDAARMAALYDEYAAVVLGFLERIADDKEKAEELLQAVFLALPSRLHEFDPEKGRLIVWILRLARSLSADGTNGRNATTNDPIRKAPDSVHESSAGEKPGQQVARRLTPSETRHATEEVQSVVELLYVKGYTFAEAAKELNVDEPAVKLLVRTELKTYRKGQS
jgi:RNA polymerase sigma-70 factor, ECF subfamily